MSDFDEVLERLLTDPSFSSALAADPDAALAGYSLDADERTLLRSQVASGTGGDSLVEARTTKSGVVGLLGPVATAFGVASGVLGSGTQSFGSAGSQTVGNAVAGAQTMGTGAAGSQSVGAAPGGGSFGVAPGAGMETFGEAGAATETFGAAGQGTAAESLGATPTEAVGYRTRVDVDGDGTWDAHTAYERGDGGVDIHADINADGVTDFIGHDYDRDGLVDVAEFDTDLDGTLETRMVDDTGDGWLDRAVDAGPQPS